MQDYYNLLGVTPTSTDDEIKSAYKKLAKQYHPDLGGDSEKFKQINEAYDGIKTADKRNQYNMRQQFGGSQPSGGFSDFQDFNVDINDIFGQVFRNGPFTFSTGFNRRRELKNKDLRLMLHVSLDSTLSAHTVNLSYSNLNSQPLHSEITLPAGIDTGSKLKFDNLGDNTQTDLTRGDLYVHITVQEHPVFSREGDNLRMAITINCFDAILGTEKIVDTLDGKKFNVKVPAGTQAGTVLSLSGQGVPNIRSGVRGNLLITVNVLIPTNLSADDLGVVRGLSLVAK
jgi:curved DNA-binding protein